MACPHGPYNCDVCDAAGCASINCKNTKYLHLYRHATTDNLCCSNCRPRNELITATCQSTLDLILHFLPLDDLHKTKSLNKEMRTIVKPISKHYRPTCVTLEYDSMIRDFDLLVSMQQTKHIYKQVKNIEVNKDIVNYVAGTGSINLPNYHLITSVPSIPTLKYFSSLNELTLRILKASADFNRLADCFEYIRRSDVKPKAIHLVFISNYLTPLANIQKCLNRGFGDFQLASVTKFTLNNTVRPETNVATNILRFFPNLRQIDFHRGDKIYIDEQGAWVGEVEESAIIIKKKRKLAMFRVNNSRLNIVDDSSEDESEAKSIQKCGTCKKPALDGIMSNGKITCYDCAELKNMVTIDETNDTTDNNNNSNSNSNENMIDSTDNESGSDSDNNADGLCANIEQDSDCYEMPRNKKRIKRSDEDIEEVEAIIPSPTHFDRIPSEEV
jgi:uncharacterized Zn finger protein (UPF0148 family)